MNRNNLSIFNSEMQEFIRFFKRLTLFCLPFILAAGFIAAVDPFNFLPVKSVVSNEIKANISPQLNPCLWKMNIFLRQPIDKILLGDSRMQAIKADDIEAVNGERYFNFGYGGASLREVIDTFWFAAENTKLQKVYLGVNLNIYNDYENTNRTQVYKSIHDNPTLYFINRTVWQAALESAYSQLTNEDLKIGVPTASREQFWQDELEIMRLYYRKFVSPKKYKPELQKIADYCRQNNIELNFIIFPNHTDEQNLIKEANLENENQQMRLDLQAFGTVYDFNTENNLTTDKANFDDPVHLNLTSRQELIREIWTGNLINGKKLP